MKRKKDNTEVGHLWLKVWICVCADGRFGYVCVQIAARPLTVASPCIALEECVSVTGVIKPTLSSRCKSKAGRLCLLIGRQLIEYFILVVVVVVVVFPFWDCHVYFTPMGIESTLTQLQHSSASIFIQCQPVLYDQGMTFPFFFFKASPFCLENWTWSAGS